jgi:hypothetical protein
VIGRAGPSPWAFERSKGALRFHARAVDRTDGAGDKAGLPDVRLGREGTRE